MSDVPSTYSTPVNEETESLIGDLFDLGGIGYVALGCGPEVVMRASPRLETDTTETSNFFEELIVNPSLLRIASQRASLDCGGLAYVAVGYADFTQLVVPMRDGHVSLGVSPHRAVRELAEAVTNVLALRGRSLPEHLRTLS